jgi:hypothetical protein
MGSMRQALLFLEFGFYGLAADMKLHFYDRTCYAELVEALAGAADTGPAWSTSVFQSRAGH